MMIRPPKAVMLSPVRSPLIKAGEKPITNTAKYEANDLPEKTLRFNRAFRTPMTNI